MKTISVSVDGRDPTGWHGSGPPRPAPPCPRWMRDMLLEVLRKPETTAPTETEPERRGRLLREILDKFKREGIGVDTGQLLTREELYDRNAAR